MGLKDVFERKNLIPLMLFVGMLQIAAYYLAGALVRPEGGLAMGHPDTLLYCQAARRIVEGAPFSYSLGTAASTGTTSVLYPFVLAIPYWMGFTGGALLSAGFVLNACFYLAFLAGWGLVILHVFGDRPIARTTAAALTACFGPSASCALVQTDIGLWMGVGAFLIWGLLVERRSVFAPLLVVAPWLRPEGMIFVVAFGAVLTFRTLVRRRIILLDWLIAFCGMASMLGVFALNNALTGVCQFSSVVDKGYFTTHGFAQAVYATAGDWIELAKGYLLGVPQNLPRNIMFVPVIGAVTLWIGIFRRDWRTFSWREGVVLLALAGSVWTVSTSGLQDKNLDRYLAWGFPLAFLFIAEGCDAVAKMGGGAVRRFLLPAINCGFTAAMAIVFVCIFHFSADRADRHRAFAERCEQVMAPGKPVGAWTEAEIAYAFSPRRLAHLCGVYSPEFHSKTATGVFEILKREPDTRYYYYYAAPEDAAIFAGTENVLMPRQLLTGPDGHELRVADWTACDAAERTEPPLMGVSLCDRVDVGYEKEERAHDYRVLTNYHMPEFHPFLQAGKRKGETIVDGGRVVFGGDEMSVNARPGRDLHVVMRTYPERKVHYARMLGGNAFRFAVSGRIRMNLSVDGQQIGAAEMVVPTDGFADVAFTIPGSSITTSRPRIAFLGDHITCGYWFYQ